MALKHEDWVLAACVWHICAIMFISKLRTSNSVAAVVVGGGDLQAVLVPCQHDQQETIHSRNCYRKGISTRP